MGIYTFVSYIKSPKDFFANFALSNLKQRGALIGWDYTLEPEAAKTAVGIVDIIVTHAPIRCAFFLRCPVVTFDYNLGNDAIFSGYLSYF